jgi:hypothetical protein
MPIDIGDTPTGTPPTSGEKLQIRSAIGLGQTDAPTFLTAALSSQGLANAPSLAIGIGAGFYQPTNTQISFSANGSEAIRFTGGGIRLGTNELGWGTFAINSLILARDADGILAQRNGTAKQTLRIYNTYTSATVYERAVMDWNGPTPGNLQIGTEFLGSGSGMAARPIDFVTGGVVRMSIAAGGGVNVTAGNFQVGGPAEGRSLGIGLVPLGTHSLLVGNGNSTTRAQLGLQQSAGQTANLLEWINSSSAVMGVISSAGNVGIGTAVPTSRLHVQATGVAFTRESILKCTLSDSGNDVFEIFNGTSIDGRFVPSFSGANFSNSASNCLSFLGQTVSGNDIGTSALVTFIARITASQTDPNNSTFTDVANRPLFYWANWATPVMQILANGNLGIGTTSPTSKLQVSAGDIEVDTITKGLILKSPDGTRYRVTVPNGGTVLTITAV